jgi:hypothetical protein
MAVSRMRYLAAGKQQPDGNRHNAEGKVACNPEANLISAFAFCLLP